MQGSEFIRYNLNYKYVGDTQAIIMFVDAQEEQFQEQYSETQMLLHYS